MPVILWRFDSVKHLTTIRNKPQALHGRRVVSVPSIAEQKPKYINPLNFCFMRQIEKKMAAAFFGGYNFHESNTAVTTGGKIWDYERNAWQRVRAVVTLHGNLIAALDVEGRPWFSCAGWHTITTRSRLAALGAPVKIKDYTMIRTDTGETFPDKLTRF